MKSCIEGIQVFVERNYYKPNKGLHHYNLDETSRMIYKL